MSLLQQFKEHVLSEKLFSADEHLLIAVSGGLDSVVLCNLCMEAGITFSVAHCHFGLRGAESDRDAAFVQDFAEKMGVPFYIQHFNAAAFAKDNGLSIQAAARQLRYDWFSQLMGEHKDLKWLLTAHHADDHVETMLMQFCKGTGISGLKGIPQKRGRIIRPLLFASKERLRSYALENQLIWIEDSSNNEIKYTRNYFRHTVLPAIEKQIPEVSANVLDNAARLADAEMLYMQAVDMHKQKLVEFKGAEVHIPILKLERTAPLKTVIVEIIKEYNFSPQQAGEVIKLLCAESGKFITSATHRILRNRKWLVISPLRTVEQSLIIIDEITDKVTTGDGELKLQLKDASEIEYRGNASVAYLAEQSLTFPLILRKWKTGDYFYPLGMKKKKKLARFFIDQKLSLGDKETTWIIESDKRIAWVVAQRIDDRFRVTPGTKKVLQLSWSSL